MNEQPHHLAPVALLILWVKNVVALWPIFVGGLFSMFGSKMSFKELLFWLALILGSVTLMLGWSILRYLRFTYSVAPDGLTIQSGVFIRKTNHIPYDRIQTVQRQQWFFLKPLRLEQVSIETAGKETRKAEGQLPLPTPSIAIAKELAQNQQHLLPLNRLMLTLPPRHASSTRNRFRTLPIKSIPTTLINMRSHRFVSSPSSPGSFGCWTRLRNTYLIAGISKPNTPSRV
jgi:putative membrane protein